MEHFSFKYFPSAIKLDISIFQDTYSNVKELDPILEELQTSVEKIETYDGKPYMYMEEKLSKLNYTVRRFGLIRNDTVFYYDQNHINYYRALCQKNVSVIDTMVRTVNFKRNKEALKDLGKYFEYINSYFDYRPCDTCLVEHVVYQSKKDTSTKVEKNEYVIDEPYLAPYKRFEQKVAVLNKNSEFSTSPFIVYEILLSPLIYGTKFLGLEGEHVEFNVRL